MNPLKQLGQMFIIGFPGQMPSSAFLNFIAEEEIGGVILFADNCVTHSAARQNIDMIRSAYHHRAPFIAIDQEGGRVCRLKGAPVEYRAAASYGAEGNVEHFIEEYSRAAVYMESLGININLAPVADIALDKDNSCIKDRSFGDNPGLVSLYVTASVKVSKMHGLISCLKHFPGFGAAKNDPHVVTAVADYDYETWTRRERIPFQSGLEAGADMLMTTHMLVPSMDNTIVTGSDKIINDLVRGALAFDGPIITDDLTMGGAAVLGDIGERTVAAFNAGHDLLLFGQDFDAAVQAYDYFCDACTRGEVDSGRLRSSLERVAGLKFKVGRSVPL
jgi:beta-N-acetylhexosaminidase